jgi:hypothetical protein
LLIVKNIKINIKYLRKRNKTFKRRIKCEVSVRDLAGRNIVNYPDNLNDRNYIDKSDFVEYLQIKGLDNKNKVC